MKIGIIGAGSVGLLFAAKLSASFPVTLYTKTKTQAKLLNDNGILLDGTKVKSASFHASSETIYEEDIQIVTVKQYQLEKIVGNLKRTTSRTVIFLQNGMSHISCMNELAHHRLYVGVVEHGALKINDYHVCHTGKGLTRLSAYHHNDDKNLKPLLVSKLAVFPFIYEEDWYEMLSKKLLVNICINPLTALFKVKNGGLLQNDYLYKLFETVFDEAFLALKLNNREFYWRHVHTICEKTSANTSSMLEDILHHRRTEVDAIVGYMLEKAKREGMPVPALRFLYFAIKGLEEEKGELT
ncbi:2-dehydropantoate 2-reductase [Metabacillus arenae]|uniref:2-dehydropantoate 2-reductase n=1 Tax=Metabacillus arenae TaxID=2771434 RepID=A0A926NFL6_9BACI|nr:2-dehydropantoate 2-reductase [Metabacillus arenae]MBD1379920.1 2-dehydropantoate 2-reductase [Metabacillus arenae]